MAVVLSQTGKGKKLILKVTVEGENFPTSSNVVGLWRKDTNEIVGHTDVAANKFNTEFHLDHYLSLNLEVKFCVYTVKDGNTDADSFVGCYETSLKDLFKGKKVEAKLDCGAVLNFTCVVLPDPNAKKKEKKPKKEEGPQLSKEEKKKIATSLKEGGKKGQDICGMSAFGVHFFCVAVDSCPDDWELFEKVMEGMNKPVDPDGDDRKGGAADLAKVLFSAGPTKVLMYAHVPDECKDKATVKEFLEAVAAPLNGKVTDLSENFGKAEAAGDPDNNLFPLKMRDQAIAAGFEFLRSKSLILDDDGSDDDINFADECGIDLNAGADAEDY